MTEQASTPKQVISDKVQSATKTRHVQYGEEKFVVKKLAWGRFKSLLVKLREFIADILPEQMTDEELDGLTNLQGFNLPQLIRKFPIDFVEDIIEYGLVDPPLDFEETLNFDTLLFLTAHIITLNFLDNTGVQSFFTAFVTVIKPAKENEDEDVPKKTPKKITKKTRRH